MSHGNGKTEGQAYAEAEDRGRREEARQRCALEGTAHQGEPARRGGVEGAEALGTGTGCCAGYSCREYGTRRAHCCEHRPGERDLYGGPACPRSSSPRDPRRDTPSAEAERAEAQPEGRDLPRAEDGVGRSVEVGSGPEGRDLSGVSIRQLREMCLCRACLTRLGYSEDPRRDPAQDAAGASQSPSGGSGQVRGRPRTPAWLLEARRSLP